MKQIGVETIQVDSKIFKKYLRRRSISNAFKLAADKLKEQLNLPEASKKTAGEYVIVNEENKPIGKIAISHRDAYEVKGGYMMRVS